MGLNLDRWEHGYELPRGLELDYVRRLAKLCAIRIETGHDSFVLIHEGDDEFMADASLERDGDTLVYTQRLGGHPIHRRSLFCSVPNQSVAICVLWAVLDMHSRRAALERAIHWSENQIALLTDEVNELQDALESWRVELLKENGS